jgi:spoIIIJ-associated protein
MKSIEVEGKTKDEALAKGLASLGLSRAQVRVDVLDEGGRGFLGLGGKPARLRLQPVAAGEMEPAEVVRTLLELMEVKFALAVETRGDETDIRIDAPEDDGLLIGRRGQTLDALRHLSQRIVAARKGRNAVVNIDVGDYRARREAGLAEKAVEAADQVVTEGRSMTLDPMSAQDRRIVHVALAEREDVSTYTVGRGSRRRVVIAPGGGRSEAQGEDRDEMREVRGESRGDETAYDRVPDPGFRAQRLPFENGEDEDAAMVAAEAQWRREEERERLREAGAAGQGGQRPPRRERAAAPGAPAATGSGSGEQRERAPRRRGGRSRGDGRGRDGQEGRERGPRGRSERTSDAPPPEESRPREAQVHEERSPDSQERPARSAERGREDRGREERGGDRHGGRGREGRGRERGPREPRDRDDRRREDAGAWGHGGEAEDSSGPAATRKEDLSPPRIVGDESQEKAFPTELARRVLRMGGEDSSQSARRRKRR